MEFLCSPTRRLNQRYNPSIGWRSSSKLSRLYFLPQTMSRSLWAWWNRPRSIHSHRPQSSQFPCTSPQSCDSCLVCLRASQQRKGKLELSSTAFLPECSLWGFCKKTGRDAQANRPNLFCVYHLVFCLELWLCLVKVLLAACLLLVMHQHGFSFVYCLAPTSDSIETATTVSQEIHP